MRTLNTFISIMAGIVGLSCLSMGCEEAQDIYADFEIVLPSDNDPMQNVTRLRYTLYDPDEPENASVRDYTGSDLDEFSFLSGRIDMLPELVLKIEGFDATNQRVAWGTSLASNPELQFSANRALYFASSSSISTAPLELVHGRVGAELGLPNSLDVLIVGGQSRSDELADTVANVEIFSPLTWTVGLLTTLDGEAVQLGNGMVDHAVSAINSHSIVVAGGRQRVSGTESLLDTVYILDSYDSAVVRSVEAEGSFDARLAPCLAQTGDGTALLIGGYADTERTTPLNDIWRIEADTSRMTKISSLPEGFEVLACAPIYMDSWLGAIVLGIDPNSKKATVSFIDNETLAITSLTVDWPNVSGVTAQAMGQGKVLFVGGGETTSGLLYSHSCLESSCNAVEVIEDLLSSKRSNPSVTLTEEADLLACGGQPEDDGMEAARSCDRLAYDANGDFGRIERLEMAFPRAEMTAAGLANGNVVLLGGGLPTSNENAEDSAYPDEIETEIRTIIEVFTP